MIDYYSERADQGTPFPATDVGKEIPVIVTRHPALVELLRELNIIPTDAALCGLRRKYAATEGAFDKYFEIRLIEHVTPADISDRWVIGILPLHLAASAFKVTTVTLNVPVEMRGVELSVEQLRQYYGGVATYEVTESLPPSSRVCPICGADVKIFDGSFPYCTESYQENDQGGVDAISGGHELPKGLYGK